MSKNNFNKIAHIYDLLAQSVFGNAILNAQKEYLHTIRPGDHVLILGGGTGKILLPVLHQCANCQITFLDSSEAMVYRAKKRLNGNKVSNVQFIVAPFETWTNDSNYDVVIAPFFLDIYSSEQLDKAAERISQILKSNGILLISDFQLKKSSGLKFMFQSLLLYLMHRFFSITCNMESKSLKDIHSVLVNKGYLLIEESSYYRDMIFSRVYTWDRTS